ncbi:hypothetical protein GUJ93_ZPchr0004g39413 [Zizania palustris]|uniref:Poly [ADP-ribose] polymerase n=1 Tax=Zizania palustris TaxID=103762 RepID=A0A8J5S2N0_ZIZPA|nr:hypothetical protein GUJ93_ZPchr0004g39413 [Zizania palustris]
MASLQEANSLCLKRKLVDDCLSKECKSRRTKAENGPSSDSSAKRCKCCCTRPNLASDCVNYLKSGVPSRVMFYKQGSWHKFPEQIMKSLIEEFRSNKSSVVAVMDDEPVLVDFLSMTLVNLKSRKQRSVAWFDETGKCFYPSLFFDEEADEAAKVGGNFEGIMQGIMLEKVANSPPEVVKQVVLECSPPVSPVPQKPSTADVLRKKITSVERGSEGFLFAQDLFLSGMGPFAMPNNILHIHRYSPNDITAQCRLQAFEKQMMSTKEERGDANVRYGWLGSRKNDIVRILINGFGNGSNGKPAEKAGLSAGVYLSPEDRAFSSVGLCDVDDKGVQYMLLCRLILGNMEAVMPESQDSFPSSEIYDSGVDDCSNPKCYVMWPSHLSTHIRLEYLVSFRLSSKVRNYLLGLKGLWFHPSPKEVVMDISTLLPIMSETAEGPTSPWISFKVLFSMIQESISSVAKELLFHHHEELKENKITREEMVKQMIILVGEKLLLETLKKLHYCPSLWYKSTVKVASGDPARMAAEDMPLDKTAGNCSLAVSVAHGDSHAPNAVAENNTALCTKRCDTSATGMVTKGHGSLAPNGVSETSVSAGAIYGASPIQTTSSGNTTNHYAKNLDLSVSRMAPIVCDDLLRIASAKSSSLGAKVCNSVKYSAGSSGCPSTEPTNATKSHGIFTLGLSPKGCESLVPSLALGNSKCAIAEGLNSAPRVTPKDEEFLSLRIATQSPVLHSGKGHDGTSGATLPVDAPGHGNPKALTIEDCDSLSLSIAPKPKAHDLPVPSNEHKHHASPTSGMVPESHQSQAPSAATKGYNTPTPITRDSDDQRVQSGARSQLPEPDVNAISSNVARAADTLIALSTLREKGR